MLHEIHLGALTLQWHTFSGEYAIGGSRYGTGDCPEKAMDHGDR